MAIYLTDPRQQAIDQIGFSLGNSFGEKTRQRGLKKDAVLGAEEIEQIRQNSLKPQHTPEEYQSAINQLKQQYADLGLIGTNPLEGITQSKQAWSNARTEEEREAAHRKAEALRQIALSKGMSLEGFGADDPLKTPEYNFSVPALPGGQSAQQIPLVNTDWLGKGQGAGQGVFGSVLARGKDVTPEGGLLSSVLSRRNAGEGVPSKGGGVLSAALSPNQKFFEGPDQNLITLEDLDKLSGGKYSPAVAQVAQVMARQRADDNLINGSTVMEAYKRFNQMGMDPESIDKLMTLAQNMQQDTRKQRAYEIAGQMVLETDPARRAAMAAQMNALIGGGEGTKAAENLAQGHKQAQFELGDRVEMVDVTTPNKYGMGKPEATTIINRDKGISPTNKAELQQRERQLEANNALNWAKLRQDANGIGRVIQGDDGIVYGISNSGEVRQLANISGFSKGDAAKARSLQAKMNYAIQLYKSSVNPYDDGVVTPGMQRALADYEAAAGELDALLSGSNSSSRQVGQGQKVDYNSAIRAITAALDRNAKAPAGQRWSRQQFEDYIRQNYGDLGDKLINDSDFKTYGL